ncbi:hypothetical protein AVEN_42893-1 [Araneus ventricosus]|uniref:Uncharacterized protein n=1 Tax=Araneus ventricosus TaxID=182803 RepID=A0A4Y2AHD3_ARAVE|nr:hypothetical protein AVEN_42893-1 [Araneus ventricosus]
MKRLGELEDRPNSFPISPIYVFQIDSQTLHIRRTNIMNRFQNSVRHYTNGWTYIMKASQLLASLQVSGAEVLHGILADKLMVRATIEKALESRFGDNHLTQFHRTELKTIRQKQGESLQVLTTDVE